MLDYSDCCLLVSSLQFKFRTKTGRGFQIVSLCQVPSIQGQFLLPGMFFNRYATTHILFSLRVITLSQRTFLSLSLVLQHTTFSFLPRLCICSLPYHFPAKQAHLMYPNCTYHSFSVALASPESFLLQQLHVFVTQYTVRMRIMGFHSVI